MTRKSTRLKYLKHMNISGTGCQIYTDILFETSYATSITKISLHPIASGIQIQPPSKEWNKLVEDTLKEMIDLWNEKYAETKDKQNDKRKNRTD